MTAVLRLYPRRWRERHGDEMAALLEDRPPSLADRVDLARGAIDAHLHPPERSRLPAVAGLTGGAAWTVGGLVVLTQPLPPDWPGYLFDMLPLAIVGAASLLVAVVACWLRLGDARDTADRLALDLAVAGHVAWIAALAAALLAVDYGPTTAVAATAAAFGTALVGLALLRAGDAPRAALLVTAASLLVVPATWSFVGFGLAWSAIGLLAVPPEVEPTIG